MLETQLLKIEIYGDGIIELNGNFDYDPITKIYSKDNLNIHASQSWLKYSKINVRLPERDQIGVYEEFYKSGMLRRKLEFSQDDGGDYLLHGREIVFYEDEDSEGEETYTILEENYYLNGEKVGIWKKYSIDGGLISETNFDNIVIAGNGFSGVEYKNYYPDTGKIALFQERNQGRSYYPDGRLKAEWESLDFIHHGKFVEYYTNGQVKLTVNYKNMSRDGIMLKYYESGSIKEEWEYRDGQQLSIFKYYESGVVKSEWIYESGELKKKLLYDKNGNLKKVEELD